MEILDILSFLVGIAVSIRLSIGCWRGAEKFDEDSEYSLNCYEKELKNNVPFAEGHLRDSTNYAKTATSLRYISVALVIIALGLIGVGGFTIFSFAF